MSLFVFNAAAINAAQAVAGSSDSPTAADGRDMEVYDDIQARLEDLRVFARDGVGQGAPHNVLMRSANQYPAAAITPLGWLEGDRFDGDTLVRSPMFSLTLMVADEDERTRYRQLEHLANLAANAIHGQRLAGFTLARLTTLARGSLPPSDHPEQRLVMNGSFAYLVPGRSARLTTQP